MNCQDLEQYLAEELDGELSPERRAELLAHVKECPACRAECDAYRQLDGQLEDFYQRRLKTALESPTAAAEAIISRAEPAPHRRRLVRRAVWAMAALALVALGLALWPVYRSAVPTGRDVLATVAKAQGPVLLLEHGQYKPLAAGEPVRQARRIKVTPDGYLALKLNDGNTLEVRGGTQLTLNQFPDRFEVGLHRGSVWAHLNHKPKVRFLVRTAHLKAVATGTVYGVEEGLGGSVVTVARGTVSVEAGTNEVSVGTGESYASREGAERLAAATDWSQMPEDLTALASRQTAAAAPTPAALTVDSYQPMAAAAATTTTPTATAATPAIENLADLLPEGANYFITVHDWPALLGEFAKSDYSALTREESIKTWWSALHGQAMLDEWVKDLHLLEVLNVARMIDGQALLAVVPPRGDFLLLADCGEHEAQIRARVEEILRLSASQTGNTPTSDTATAAMQAQLELLDPASPAARKLGELHEHVQVVNGRLIISSSKDLERETAGRVQSGEPTHYTQSEFYQKVTANVERPRFMMAADLAGAVARLTATLTEENDKEALAHLDFLGLPNLDYLLISPSFKGRGMNQAARLGFVRERSGLAGWLGEAAPMRGHGFFSPDVHFFAAAITRAPRQMVFDYISFLNGAGRAEDEATARAFLERHGALLDALGREVAIGVDNPIFPVPNIKLAVEVLDRPAAEAGLDQLIGDLMAGLDREGKYFSYREATAYKNTTIHTLIIEGAPLPLRPSYAFIDDFVVFGPGPEFVRDSLDVYESGHSIASDSRLAGLLPSQAGTQFSLLVYQDVAKAMPGLLKNTLFKQLSSQEAQLTPNLDFLERYRAPGIAYACAYPAYVDFFLSAPTGIDFNLGMAVPLVANWLAPRTSVGAQLEKYLAAKDALARMKTAAEAYATAHAGAMPGSLSELAGQMGGQVPVDPFGEHPGDTLRLIPGAAPGQIVLYSIGPDQIDEQGAAAYDPAGDINGGGDIAVSAP